VRGRIENILDWAVTRGYRPRGQNPAEWSGHLKHSLPKPSTVKTVSRFAVMPYAEIGAFVKELRAEPTTSARALEFLILTATRANETIGAKWAEIDMDALSGKFPRRE
jgi:integrase